jgi:TetR/AcrR family transcriptional regulator, regulator of cefoperazone and chloramphenicol sensitivity
VPRDSAPTRERLVREAERLFARHGLYRVTVREITEAAGQRNVSALNYHFGSREGIIEAILVRHGDRIDELRGESLVEVGTDASLRKLVAALVTPYATALHTSEGRDYLRIVAQMSDVFATWGDERPGTGPWLREILSLIEQRLPLPPALRGERVLGMIMLMTATMAERARAVESGASMVLDEPAFLANLTDMLVGVLEASASVDVTL